MKVLAFGEILWDIIRGEEHLGGAPFNFAAHAVQCGNSAFIVSRLGSDYLGMKAFNLCKTFGVNDRFIQWDENYPTGVVDVTLKDGQPDYTIIKDVAWDRIALNATLEYLNDEKFDVFYFGSLAQRSEVSAITLHHILDVTSFKHIFYDVNLRKLGYTEPIIKRSLARATILKLNHEEVPVIAQMLVDHPLAPDAFCKCVRSLYPNINTIIVTAAEKGCYVFHNDTLTCVAGKQVQVIDAVGAGDAFSAAFMHVYVRTGDPNQAAAIANTVGAFVATQHGAIPTYSSEIVKALSTTEKVTD